jgi:hypothetical protein
MEEQVSMTIKDYEEEDILDDAASSKTEDSSDHHDIFTHFARNGMIKIGKETEEYVSMKTQFLMGMKQYRH